MAAVVVRVGASVRAGSRDGATPIGNSFKYVTRGCFSLRNKARPASCESALCDNEEDGARDLVHLELQCLQETEAVLKAVSRLLEVGKRRARGGIRGTKGGKSTLDKAYVCLE